MQKARILLSGNQKLQYYIDAVEGAGGIGEGYYLPKIDTDYDGLILCGGNDIDPSYYGQEMDGTVNIDYERDKVEFALMRAFVEAGKPVFGICRGCQLINIFFGGTLYQDLKNSHLHSSFSSEARIHNVYAAEGSAVKKWYGTYFPVNSFHHQAVNQLGDGLKVTMTSDDAYGVIEGVEHSSLPVFGVQWHPERMCFEHKQADTVDGAKVFQEFLAMCKK